MSVHPLTPAVLQDPKLPLRLSIRYSVLQGSYWTVFCSLYTYAAVYLLSCSFDSTAVGVIMAAGNVLGLLLQPVFASMADRRRPLNLHQLTCLLAGVFALLALGLYLIPLAPAVTAALFILMDGLMWVLMPLVNSLSMYYVNLGIPVNYGIPRGIGSIAYAVVSSLIGIAIASTGAAVTQLFTFGELVILIVSVLSLPQYVEEQRMASSTDVRDNDGILSFARRYPRFMAALLGFAAIFIFHNMTNCYMIYMVKNLGGTEAIMGRQFSIVAIGELPAMFGITWLLSRFRETTLMRVSVVVYSLKALGYVLAFNLPLLLSAQMLQSCSYALFIPTSVYFVNSIMAEQDKVKGQSFVTMANTLGGVIGTLLGGVLLSDGNVQLMLRAGLALAVFGSVISFIFMGTPRNAKKTDR